MIITVQYKIITSTYGGLIGSSTSAISLSAEDVNREELLSSNKDGTASFFNLLLAPCASKESSLKCKEQTTRLGVQTKSFNCNALIHALYSVFGKLK